MAIELNNIFLDMHGLKSLINNVLHYFLKTIYGTEKRLI